MTEPNIQSLKHSQDYGKAELSQKKNNEYNPRIKKYLY